MSWGKSPAIGAVLLLLLKGYNGPPRSDERPQPSVRESLHEPPVAIRANISVFFSIRTDALFPRKSGMLDLPPGLLFGLR